MTARERCADGCARRGDEQVASAPPAHRWLLVEQPGPWGFDALRQSTLDPELAGAIAARAAALHARVLLVRRPGRTPPGPRRWAYVDADQRRAWWAEMDTILTGDPTGGEPSGEPLYLVCAHGGHDPCCAIRGRPVAAALHAAHPGRTWECSHVGGDRFAANLVILPDGLYYGQVPASRAVDVVTEHEAGRVVPDLLRGRTVFAAPAQAAQHFARAKLGETAIDALRPLRVEHVGHERWLVVLAASPAPVRVEVRAAFSRSDTPLTCSASVPAAVRHFELVGFTTGAAAPDR